MDASVAPVATNALLDRLSVKIQASLAPHLRRVKLAQGVILKPAKPSPLFISL